MSVDQSDVWNCNKLCQGSELPPKYIETGEIVDSKIRKFFFLLQEKQIERDLRVTISVSVSDKIGEQNMLSIELTNDINPTFLFVLSITKADFEILKNDQGLNVEFKDFPNALVKLLERCKDSVADGVGRFKLMLEDYFGTAAGGRLMDMNKLQVKIIEECAFRNVCHLTLDIMRGTELQIRRKLETEVCKAKQSLLKLSTSHDEALIKIADLVDEINDKNTVIENSNSLIEELRIEKENECCRIRNEAESQERMIREEYSEKFAEERKQFERQCDLMQTKLQNLESELRLLHERELETQNLFHEKQRERELIEVELISKKQEINQLRTQNEKLDCDYHDKEKAVNILRTRLAVAEQELKDNNVLLLNLQNKLDELVHEKKNFQVSLDFLQNELEKKKGTIKNLSDEIMKANEIIAKQQSKLKILSSKLIDCESDSLKLKQVVKNKEDELCQQGKELDTLKEHFTSSVKESNEMKEEIRLLKKNIVNVNNIIENKCKIISKFRKKFEDVLTEFNSQQKPQQPYRQYLSLPTLLPSDCHRYTDDLWDVILQDHSSCSSSSLTEPSTKSFNFSRIIKPYIFRYLNRLQCAPLPRIKSLDAPLSMSAMAQPSECKRLQRTPSLANVNNMTEYAVYNNIGAEKYLQTARSDPCVSKNKDPVNRKTANACKNVEHFSDNVVRNEMRHKSKEVICEANKGSRENKVFGLGNGSSDSPPHYAPVSAFRFRPPKILSSGLYSNDQFKGSCQSMMSSNVRKTPAVRAPPLTPAQRNAVEFVFKASRLPQTDQQNNTPSLTKHSVTNTLMPSVSLRGVLKPQVANKTQPNKYASSTVAKQTLPVEKPFKVATDGLEKFAFNKNDYNSKMKPAKKLLDKSESTSTSLFEVSVDFPEPSAYFAS